MRPKWGKQEIEQLTEFKPIATSTPLHNHQKVDLVEKYVDSKGVHRVKGSSNMKASQHYPIQQLGVDPHFLLGV